MQRFENFREATHQDLTVPFTGDDMIRFFTSILRTCGIPLCKNRG